MDMGTQQQKIAIIRTIMAGSTTVPKRARTCLRLASAAA